MFLIFNSLKLNICFAYNSTEEIFRVKNNIKREKEDNETIIGIEEFEKYLYGGYNCQPDILIRTSGENRLSNFLLYQCRFSLIFFEKEFWPSYQLKDFLKLLIRYNFQIKEHKKNLQRLSIQSNFKIINN